MDDVVDCLARVTQALDARDLRPGALAHVVAQLETAVTRAAEGETVRLERAIQSTVVTPSGEIFDVNRIIDVVSTGIFGRVHTEIKTGRFLENALDTHQLAQDLVLSIRRGVSNVWDFSNIEFSPGNVQMIQARVRAVTERLFDLGFSEEQISRALSRFQLVDKIGDEIRAELDENGDVVFRNALGELFDEDGKIAQEATRQAGNSPDFSPAMLAIFGPSGQVADAAAAAANQANLDPAMDSLEQKVEEGVEEALEQAGTEASATAAASLGSQIAAGANALGNALTSIPQLYHSVTALGEAWDRPLRSTEDYMNLLSAAGGTITQGVQTIQALAGITQLATAAQSAFNFVMAMNPVVLVVIAVVALIAAVVALIYYWDEVKAAVRDNPWLPLLLGLLGPLGIVIGLVIAIAAHWEEVKLAVLEAANFISIQAQRIGAFFVGVYNLAGQVWGAIVATAENAGIGVANGFISVGTDIQNFFIGIVNHVLSMYNAIADSVVGDVLGLETAALIPEVDVQTRLIPPREVPTIDVAAAFDTGPITGGLEEEIAAQEEAVAAARAEDERRRAEDAAAEEAAAAAEAAPPAEGPPALPAALAPPAAPGVPPALPALPAGAAPLPAAAGAVTVNGGITVNINAERLEADAAQLLSDEIIAQLQARLSALRAEQDFRTGVRA